MPHRTPETVNPVKRLWEQYAPVFHVIGFIILCTFIFATNYDKFTAYGATLNDHEARIVKVENATYDNHTAIAQVNQKLDDMISFWKVPHKQ